MFNYRRLLFFVLIIAVIILPVIMPTPRPQASNILPPQANTSTESEFASAPYPNFDIRSEHFNTLGEIEVARDGVRVARDGISALSRRQLDELEARLPSLEVRWNSELETPRMLFSYHAPLTLPSDDAPVAIAEQFLREHRELLKLDKELNDLKVTRDYQTKHNGAHHLTLQQQYRGLEVFGGEARFAITREKAILAVSNDLVPTTIAKVNTLTPKLSAREALARAAENVGISLDAATAIKSRANTADRRTTFSAGAQFEMEPAAKLILFPMSGKQTRLAWQVRLADRHSGNHYAIFVDAAKGTILLRHNLTWYFAQGPTYRVYTGNTPQPNLPFISTNPPVVERELVNTNGDPVASPNGWVSPANPTTRGNNVIAQTDPSGQNTGGVMPKAMDLNFDFPLVLFTAGQEPENFTSASVTNLFYRCNIIHDYLYKLGFDEASGNFQDDIFGRGGVGNDPVIADAQDGGGFNNANFSTSEDGIPGRMQMYLWRTATPKVDASYDAEVVVHEYVHGLSTRLVGGPNNVIALFGTQSGGMGEGWSDWYAMSILSKPGDDPRGRYPFGNYVTRNFTKGIRRFPYSTDMKFNPLTYRDLDPTQSKVGGLNVSEVHNVGEIWCQTLWDLRADFIDAYGFVDGKQRVEQLVTDALKVTTTNPTLVDGRDGLLLADQLNNNGANQCLIWQAFARRGLGFGAFSLNGSSNRVKESFLTPPYCNKTGAVTIDRKGYFDGETININLGDLDLVGSKSASIKISSAMTGDNETLVLPESNQIPGQFSGQLRVVIGAVNANDGTLQTALGDTITVSYQDNSTTSGQSGQASVTARVLRSQTVSDDAIENGPVSLKSDGNWQITTKFAHSPTHSWTDSPNGNYQDKNNVTLTSKKFNLTGLMGARLVFWQRYDVEQDFDYAIVEVKAGKQPWQPVASYTGTVNEFRETTIDLSQFDGAPKLAIRFRLFSDDGVTGDGWYIDDVKLVGGATN